MKLFRGILGTVLGVVFASSMITVIVTVAIWPGEAKLLAPLFCDDVFTDPFVVTDVTSSAGETSYNFSLHCMSERGDVVNHGFIFPFLILMGFHSIPLWLFVFAHWVLVRLPKDPPVLSFEPPVDSVH